MKIAAILLLVSVFAIGAYGANWAVIVAGSNGFWNYRHQTDACHANSILAKNGIPAENIIHFSYNDVANDGSNPFRGKLFNKPDPSGPGVDVYADCKIDYQKGDVTPQNFINVLKGNETAMHGKGTGKVLKSGSGDKVFIYFTDHGATDLIAFPSDYLYSDDLLKTFDYMYQQKLYGELVFYLEACESGSMFVNLPKNTKIYATSAANPYESSWAYYCSPDDVVNHKSIGSCLGDEYSVKWLEDSDVADFKSTSLHTQFLTVQKNTKLSHVLEWGDQSFNTEAIGNFQGGSRAAEAAAKLRNLRAGEMGPAEAKKLDSRDVKLFYLMNKHEKTNTLESELALKEELDSRTFFNTKFEKIREILSVTEEEVAATANTQNIDCLKASVALFEEKCTKLTDYGLKFVKTLATVCNKNVEIEVILNIIENVCV